jgi:Flp pilus assembly protein TadB
VTVPLLLAVALALGVDWRRVALLAGAVYLPLVMVILVAISVWRGRSGEDHRPAQFCEGVAAELRAGASLREAVAVSAASVGLDGFSLGKGPLQALAEDLAERFPTIGEELRLTIVNAGRSGSRVASLFDEIGSLALARAEIEREVRVATAPGKATALLLVGAPLVYLTGQALSGNLERMLRSSHQRIVAMAGLGLFLVGLIVTTAVVWRATR